MEVVVVVSDDDVFVDVDVYFFEVFKVFFGVVVGVDDFIGDFI